MVWLKVDDRFHTHQKVSRIPREQRTAAVGLWLLAGTWSASHRTDGAIPAHQVEELGGTLELAAALVEVRLWKKARGGYAFVNWDEWQPTRSELDERTRIEREKKRTQRKHAGGKSPDPDGSSIRGTTVGSHGSPPLPVPSRPDPDPTPTDFVSRSGGAPVDNAGESDRPTDDELEAIESDRWGGYLGVNLGQVRKELAKRTQRVVSPSIALRIALTVIERAPRKPDKPTAYVLTSLRDDWAEWQKLVDVEDGAA